MISSFAFDLEQAMRRLFSMCFTAAFALSFLAPVALHADEITVAHAQGEARLPLNPKRVVTLDIAILGTLDAMGVDVVGVPTSPLWPPNLMKYKSDRYRKIGSLFEPDYEAINALTPDLIIVGGRSGPKYTQLAKLAPTIDLTPDLKRRIASTIEQARSLGRIFNKVNAIEDRIRSLQVSMASLRSKADAAGTGLLIMTGGGRMSAMGPGSWFGTLYDDFGVRPASTAIDAGPHGQVVSSEFILKTDPDWLYVIDRDAAIGEAGAAAKQILDNELIRQTKAWRTGRVVYLDPVNWYLVANGLVSLQAMVDEVSSALARP